MTERPDTQRVLAGLKDFQRLTADYVTERFYGSDPTRRFLVADEVGLGKTLVARGVIAQTIERLWDSRSRIDVLYICSNADIAKQNIQRLKVPGCSAGTISSRLTLLPLQAKELGTQKINFIALTPGTSFEQSDGGGRASERVLIYWLLDRAWSISGRAAALYVLGDWVRADRFQRYVDSFDTEAIDANLSERFVRGLKEEPALKRRFEDLCTYFCRVDAAPPLEQIRARSNWLGDIRRFLARICLHSLKPDLIILDEFQRFRYLLEKDSPAGELADHLFTYSDESNARVLLLSATPYKMLSLHDEDEDHYENFLVSLKFLDPGALPQFQTLLAAYREAVSSIHTPDGIARLRAVKEKLQARLRMVMARTERLAQGSDRGGMLTEVRDPGATLSSRDVTGYLGLQTLCDTLGEGDLLEYWKSAPYLFNFMDDYKLKRSFDEHEEGSDLARDVLKVVRNHPSSFINVDRIRSYKGLATGNANLRSIIRDTIESEAWRLLWIPPTLPYYEMTGAFAEPRMRGFTKRLVFSSWNVVPKTVAALISYEAERRMIAPPGRSALNTTEARKRRRGLLRFSASEGRLTGMPLISMVYPSQVLSRVCDPRELVQKKGELLPAREIAGILASRIGSLIKGLHVAPSGSGKADERWYWLTPLLLDIEDDRLATRCWWSRESLAQTWAGVEASTEDDRWGDHVTEAKETLESVCGREEQLGPMPDDLAEILALIGVAGPANCIFRALLMTCGVPSGEESVVVRDAAAKAGRDFLSYFNHAETRELLRSIDEAEPYWLRVLEYFHSGCIQATLDEYSHVLRDSLGLLSEAPAISAPLIAGALSDAITLRTAALRIDSITAPSYARRIEVEKEAMRIRFAMRYGDEQNEDDALTARTSNVSTRKERVRAAFNSPFWPFVLATTSVGQEGLDFHNYCHAVVHWNLPSNPVDLEQREGRVHRYKGHAIRKNVGAAFGMKALTSSDADPWESSFELAKNTRETGASDIVPYWLYQGDAKIERHLSMLPLSRESRVLPELRKALTVYRIVFGQTRQEDLVAYLLQQVPEDQRQAVCDELAMDLSPGCKIPCASSRLEGV